MELLLGLIFGLIPIGLLVLLIVYISKTNVLQQKLTWIEMELHRLRQLEDEVAALKSKTIMQKPGGESQVSSQRETEPIPHQRLRTLDDEIAELRGKAVGQKLSTAPLAVAHPTVTLALSQAKPSRTREEWEALIGGKLLNRIGALALIIGVGFFLKYAFDNEWITETTRVVIGILIGAALLVVALRAHKKNFEVFAQGLVGSGIAVLYLSVFASFSFYRLVPQVVAFLMMSAVTVLAFLQAFKYDSLAVSLLGLLGGFLTPFLLSTGEANEVGLFTYIALLDAGIFAVLLMKDRWALLEPLALGATYLVYLLWYKEHYIADDLLTTAYFLIIFWALFYSLEIYRSLRSIGSYQLVRTGVAAANALFFYSALYSIIEPMHHNVMGLLTFLFGAVYFLTALAAQRRNKDASASFSRQILIAIALLVVGTAIQFTGFKTVLWWSVEALVLVYCGLRWNLRLAWVSGITVYGCAILKLLYNPDSFSSLPVVDASLILNQRAFTFAALAVSMGVSASWLKRQDGKHQVLFARILDYFWPAVVFALLTVETTGYFESIKLVSAGESIAAINFKELMSLSVIWMAYSIPLLWFGINKKVAPWQHVALCVALLSACLAAVRGFSYVHIQDFQLLMNFRALTMLFVVAGIVLHLRWLRSKNPLGTWNANVVSSIGVVIVVLLLDLVTGETKDYFEKFLFGMDSSDVEYSRLRNLQQLSLSGVWLLYSIILMIVGIWRRQRGIRMASIVLFGFTILKIFIYDLSFLETLYRIFSFIGLGVILLAVSYLYQKYKDVILGVEKLSDDPTKPHAQV